MDSGPRHASGELVRAYAAGEAERTCPGALLAPGRATRELVRSIDALAPRRGGVVIYGETGTGKTLVAREIHARGAAPGSVQHVLNCAALSDSVLAEVLWNLDSPSADAPSQELGTVLLDEVGELSPWGQAVLLHKLQRDTSSGRGARFLAATHRDLGAMASAGTFSHELLKQLSVHRLRLVPLRARREEIGPLAFHFLRLALRSSGQSFVSVDPDFVLSLESYDWPGNVRELNNAMLRALTANESGTLSPSDLPDPVRASARASGALGG